jgi:hypothetical protein
MDLSAAEATAGLFTGEHQRWCSGATSMQQAHVLQQQHPHQAPLPPLTTTARCTHPRIQRHSIATS